MLDDLIATLQPNTRICVAGDITLSTEYIKTYTTKEWKQVKPDFA